MNIKLKSLLDNANLFCREGLRKLEILLVAESQTAGDQLEVSTHWDLGKGSVKKHVFDISSSRWFLSTAQDYDYDTYPR